MASRPTPLSELILGYGAQIGQALSNVGGIFMQRQMAQGQGIKAQVGDQVAQMESYLADPNYKWDENQRTAAEAFVTQGKTLLSMDDMAVPGSYAEWQKRGISIPKTTIRQGNASSPTQAQTQLTPYQGGVAGFLGDIGQGVTKAGQTQEEYVKDLDLARQMKLNGQQQAFTQQRDAILQKYGLESAQFDSDLGIAANQVGLDANASWQRATYFAEQMAAVGSVADPKNKETAERLLTNAKGAGLQPGDLQLVQSQYDALSSGTAALDWKDRLTQSGVGEQQLRLGEQQLTLGDQQIQLGEYALKSEDYLAQRRPIEDFYKDHAGMKAIIGEAVANGDEKYVQDVLATLKAGGSLNPEMYAALNAAGITEANIAGQLETVTKTKEFQDTSHDLQMAETNAAFTQLQTSLTMDQYDVANARDVFMGNAAKLYSASELETMAGDPNSMVGRLMASGQMNATDLKAMKRSARINGIVQEQQLNAPVVEQNLKMMEMLAAVPSDPASAENALRSSLGQLVDAGLMQEDQVDGVVSGYQNAWAYGAETQNAELAATRANTAYQQVLMSVQTNSLNGTAAEVGWTDETKAQWDAVRESYDADEESIMNQGKAAGCFSEDGMMSADNPTCANIGAELQRVQSERQAANRTFLGTLAPNEQGMALADTGNRVFAAVQNDPAFANASPEDVEYEAQRRLAVNWGIGTAPPPKEAEPATDATPKRGPLGTAAAVQSRIFPWMGANDPIIAPPGTPAQTTGQALSTSAASSGGSVAGGGTGQPQRTQGLQVSSTTGAGTTANLRSNPDFTSLVNAVSQYGALAGQSQAQLVQKLERETGIPGAELLNMAQRELTGSPAAPVAAPLYRQRAARSQ